MIGIYLNEIESKLLIPLLTQKIANIYSFTAFNAKEKFNQLEDLGVYQEILCRIYASLKIGHLSVE